MAIPVKKEPRNLCDILDELLDHMEAVADEAVEAQKEAELAKKMEQYEEAAVNIRMIYDSFLDIGFNEGQAFKLLIVMIGGAMK